MNKYEAIYKSNGYKLPYYKPFNGLLNDHEIMAEFLSDPQRIIDTPCFRQYRGKDGTIRSVEEWINEMRLYEFEPVRFVDKNTKEGRSSRFNEDYDNCIPAFNEIQAKALYLAHIATNLTDTILAEPIDDHFRKFLDRPVLKERWKVSEFDEFIPSFYWTKDQFDGGYFYTEDNDGLAMFYLDFFLKYGFERGLIPEGTIPTEIARMGNIYDYRIPFTVLLGISSQQDEENDDNWDEDEDEDEDEYEDEQEPEEHNPIARLFMLLEDLEDGKGLRLLHKIWEEIRYADLNDTETKRDLAYDCTWYGLEYSLNGERTNHYMMEYCISGNIVSKEDLSVLSESGLLNMDSINMNYGLEDNITKEWRSYLEEWVNRS